QGEGADGEPRFGMLQTIREFCLEQIDEHGEMKPLRAGHAAYFLTVAEEGAAALRGQQQGIWFDRLEEEHDNIRAALDWALAEGTGMLPLRIANAMGLFWHRHGHHVEGVRWLETCLAAIPEAHDTLHADALNHIGEMLIAQTEFERARSYLEDGLAIARALNYRIGVARLSMNLGFLAQHQSAYATARRHYDEALAMYQEIGDRDGLGATLNVLGIIAFREGDYPEARDLYEQSLVHLRAQGNQWRIANIINNIALIAHLLGDYATARRLHTENLATRRRLGDTMGIASTLTNFGQVCCDDGDAAARALLEEGLATYQELGDKVRAGRAQLFLALTLHYQGETVAPHELLQESLAVLRAVGEKPDVVDALAALGRVTAAEGDLAAARVYFRDALAGAQALHDRPRLSQLLECLAVIAMKGEYLASAARLWGAAEAVRRSAGVALAGIHLQQHERDIALAAAQCDATLWAASWESGERVAPDDLIAEVLAADTP
ncbi:MAG TPA: tetratricopeptide repeat protein, partial [Thermomicrobiales bacterium]